MDSILKIAFILYCFCSRLVCVTGGNVDPNSFQITRDKYDTFKILNRTNGTHCTTQCTKYDATCFDDDDHSCRCRCSARTTFIVSSSNPSSGKCTKDEDIVPESVPAEGFTLKNKKYNLCLSVQENSGEPKLATANCSSSLNKRWIFIKDRGGHRKLMNVATLQCLEFSKVGWMDSKDSVTIKVKPCRVNEDGQKLRPEQSGLIPSMLEQKRYYLILDNQGYLHAMQIIGNASVSGHRWTNDDGRNLMLNDIDYNGCYRFKKPEPFMLYLDNNTCHGDPCCHQFFAPILFRSNTCRVVWSDSKVMSSTAVEWSPLPNDINKSLISVQNNANITVKNLMIAQDALKTFNGSLLKLDISCNNTSENQAERHCLLLKFRSLDALAKKEFIKSTTPTTTPPATTATTPATTAITPATTTATTPATTTATTPAITPAITPATTTATTTATTPAATTPAITPATTTAPAPATTTAPTSNAPTTTTEITSSTHSSTQGQYSDKESNEESSINTLAIVVPVSLLAVILVLTLTYFMCYRKRKRDSKLSNDQELGNVNNASYSKAVYADPNRDYETPASSDQQAPPKYEYIENKDIAKPKQPAQPELKYDYATNTEIPRIKLNSNPPPSQGANNPAELKYDYAANTDIPSVKLDTNPTASQGPTNPAELKYDYAINTEIPRIKLDTQPKPEDAAETPSANTYHTLEEPKNPEANMYHTLEEPNAPQEGMYHTLEEPKPPQAAVYSTLEEPETETKPLVTYDTPHSGDPVYNVLEDSNDANPQDPEANST